MAVFANRISNIYTQSQIIKNIQFSLEISSSIYKNQDGNLDSNELAQSTLVRKASANLKEEIEARQKDVSKKVQLFQNKVQETDEFRLLVRSLKEQNLVKNIQESVNYVDLLRQISDQNQSIIQNTLKNGIEIEDRIQIENILVLSVNLLLSSSECEQYFFGEANTQFKNTFIEGIFQKQDLNIRKYFSHAYYVLSKKNTRFQGFILKELLQNIPGQEELQKRSECSQFYELLCKLLEECDQSVAEQTGVDYENLMQIMINNIQNHKSSEQRFYPQNDKILIGFLNLVEKLLELMPNLKIKFGYFVQQVFKQCLFLTNSDQDSLNTLDDDGYVKCKAQDSRRQAYKVISSLIRTQDCQNLKILLKEGLNPLCKNIPIPTSWNFTPALDTKSQYGYVGIKNLGCICYMNAMLQQFFMCEQFRYGILMADDKQPQNLVKKDNKYDVDDNVLHQLQKMFTFLESSDRQDYNPHEFCFSLKDYSGAPVNVSIQQDAQEFLTKVFDKLELGLKDTPFKNLIDGIYGFKTQQIIVCQNCKAKSTRDQYENFLSLDVKNMKNIYESLDQLILKESIEYTCESCSQKGEAEKFLCLLKLPNVMIVHLKRIVLDYDTFLNVKINSKLEFPDVLNFEPYTSEGIELRDKLNRQQDQQDDDSQQENPEVQINPPENYEYKLKGVVVHYGTADFGHYFSYIEVENDKWLEFNDSNIKEFDKKNIQQQCFGGGNSFESVDSDWGWGSNSQRDNSQNAYLLVYEKIIKETVKLTLKSEEDSQIVSKMVKLNQPLDDLTDLNPENPKVIDIDFYALQKYIPNNINQHVWSDNLKFMLEKHIYSPEFFSFINEIVESVRLPTLQTQDQQGVFLYYPQYQELSQDYKEVIIQLIEILVQLTFQVLGHAHDNAIIDLYVKKINHLLAVVPDYSMTFLNTHIFQNQQQIIDLWISCPDRLVRSAISRVVLQAINIAVGFYQLKLQDLSDVEVSQLSQIDKYNQNIIFFLRYLISIIPSDVAKNWTRFQQFFEFWANFANAGVYQTHFCYDHELIALFIDFYLEKRSPLYNLQDKSVSLGNRYTNPNFDALIQTIAELMKYAKNKNYDVQKSPYIVQNFQHRDFSVNDWNCLNSQEFYLKTFREKHNPEALAIIIKYMSYEEASFTESIVNLLLKGLYSHNIDEIKIFLEGLGQLLLLEDSLHQFRIEIILGFPQNVINKNGSYAMCESLTDQVITYDTFSIQSNSLLNLILKNRKKWENLTMVCLNKLLSVASQNRNVLDYILKIQSPCNQYLLFTDWIKPFILEYISDAQKYYSMSYNNTINREELGKETLQHYEYLQNFIQNYRDSQERYIIGRFEEENKISEEVLYEDQQTQDKIYLIQYESYAYVTKQNDLVINESVIKNEDFIVDKIDQESNIHNFIHHKQDYVQKKVIQQQSNFALQKSNSEQSGRFEMQPLIVSSGSEGGSQKLNDSLQKNGSEKDDRELDTNLNDFGPVNNMQANDINITNLNEVENQINENEFQDLAAANSESQQQEQQLSLQNQQSEDIQNKDINSNVINNTIKIDVQQQVTNMFQRFFITNNTNQNIQVQLRVQTKENTDYELNCLLPQSSIQQLIKAKSENVQIFVVQKLNPDLPLPELEYQCRVVVFDNYQQQNYGYSNDNYTSNYDENGYSKQKRYYSVNTTD